MMPRKRWRVPFTPQPPSFDAFCATYNVKPPERVALAWHLVSIRSRRLIEKLLPPNSIGDVS
jgi:hypothetical protein